MRWSACSHWLDLNLYWHLKQFGGNGVRTHVNSKRKIPSTGGSEEGEIGETASRRTASPTHNRQTTVQWQDCNKSQTASFIVIIICQRVINCSCPRLLQHESGDGWPCPPPPSPVWQSAGLLHPGRSCHPLLSWWKTGEVYGVVC